MERVVRWATLASVGLAWLALGAGPSAAASPVTVEYVSPHLTVRIPEATDLQTVLGAVCAETQARCELAAPVAAAPVAPTTVTGLWGEAVAKLLAAAGLSFTVAPVVGGHAAQIVVLGPSGPAAPAPERPPGSASEAARRSSREMPSPPKEEVAPGSLPGTPGGPPPAPPPPFAGPPGIPLGFLIPPPAPRGTMMVLPFPDPQGNPIVMPITNEPMKVLPFPGPDGRPVPVPPPQPGQQPPYPFPPTAPAPN